MNSPNQTTGPRYWRSLDQLADTPQFREMLYREFPENASEWTDPVSRRHFVKIMSASLLLGGVGMTGCRQPVENILPFAKTPENYIHGVPQFYATARPSRASALPLVVKSSEGRPTKIEGNALHPDSNGGTDVFTQAALLDLYDPDRAMRFAHNGVTASRDETFRFIAALASRFEANRGQGLSFLMDRSSSPSRARLQETLTAKFPTARWHVYEPVDFDLHTRSANTGKAVRPYYKLENAKVIVSLDCDFIGAEQDTSRLIAGFAQGRKMAQASDSPNRLYVVEALMTQTGMNADHRLRIPASAVLSVAAALASKLAPGNPAITDLAQRSPLPEGVKAEWITACADDLTAHRGQSIVLAGHRQPNAVRVLADVINAALGNVGKTSFFQELPLSGGETIGALAEALKVGAVDTLVIIGGNPAYNAPADLQWDQTQAKAKTILRLGYHEDETASSNPSLYEGAPQKPDHWDLPATHFLESWGDGLSADGSLVAIQPLVAPLFGGVTELELLARLGNQTQTNPYEIVRTTFQVRGGQDENAWKKFLHDGFLQGSAAPLDDKVTFPPENVASILAATTAVTVPNKDQLEVIFSRDYSMDDGRFNNNGWLQELPDPITKITWENVILISPATASTFGLHVADSDGARILVPTAKLELNGAIVEGPVWVQPGMADNTVGLTLGYGRKRTGRVGTGTGYNAYPLRRAAQLHVASGGKLTPTGSTHGLASTQNHWSMEGRPIIREASLKQYREHPDFAQAMNMPAPTAPNGEVMHEPMYPNPLDPKQAAAPHAWGMAIDLNRCVGCQACVMACQSENNIPIVGKDQVARSREMHWIRIDRYYAGNLSDPEVLNQPMLCQHCEAAPCESVCPVNATVHDQEGLNVMVYNRCVGTRYCSNNCPYKVRRFNYFDYNRRPLNELYKTPILSTTKGSWELLRWFKDPDRGSKADDEWNLLKMVRNPDVTVRMRGVMEKCTFCVQRIERAKIDRKIQARDSGDITVPEGTIKTACQQACPAQAITFGNLKDSNSAVAQAKKQDRNYAVLDFLLTKPRTTYLARIRNPNEKMPDYREAPLSFEEYSHHHGNPFEHGHDHGAEVHAPEEKGTH